MSTHASEIWPARYLPVRVARHAVLVALAMDHEGFARGVCEQTVVASHSRSVDAIEHHAPQGLQEQPSGVLGEPQSRGRITIYCIAETLNRDLLSKKLRDRGPNFQLHVRPLTLCKFCASPACWALLFRVAFWKPGLRRDKRCRTRYQPTVPDSVPNLGPQAYPDVLYGRYSRLGELPQGDVFYFDYGCVAFWGLTQKQEQVGLIVLSSPPFCCCRPGMPALDTPGARTAGASQTAAACGTAMERGCYRLGMRCVQCIADGNSLILISRFPLFYAQDILRNLVVPCEENPLPVSELEIDEFQVRSASPCCTSVCRLRNGLLTEVAKPLRQRASKNGKRSRQPHAAAHILSAAKGVPPSMRTERMYSKFSPDRDVPYDVQFHYTTNERPHIQNDTITINHRFANDHTIKLSISHALAQVGCRI